MDKKSYLKKWAALIIDMADGEPRTEADDMDLSVGLAQVIHMAVQASRGLVFAELAARIDGPFSHEEMEELIHDTKEVYPRRFDWE